MELILDNNDKRILRTMMNNGAANGRLMSTNEIKQLSGLNWKTVNRHLQKLKKTYEIVDSKNEGKPRKFKRGKKEVNSQRKVLWILNVCTPDCPHYGEPGHTKYG